MAKGHSKPARKAAQSQRISAKGPGSAAPRPGSARPSKKGAAKKGAGAKVAPTKRAKPRRAAMSKAADLSSAEVSILGRMATLEPNTPRYRTLEAALAFKSSWIILGEHLAEVLRTGLWRGWGYASFERYCAEEIHTTPATAKKLVRSFQWLGAEAPEYLPPKTGQRPPAEAPPGALPELSSVSVLADARRHVDEGKVSEDAYLALKEAAFDGEKPSALKKALVEAIPAHLRPRSPDDKVRWLRRALTATVKVIDSLREWDSTGEAGGDELLVQAEKLRDAIALRLPRETASRPAADVQ